MSEAAARQPPEHAAGRRILDAAARLLRHRGYEATTVRAIAEAVGMKGASIYHHFRSKDEIVARVLNDGVRVVREAVAAALSGLPPDADPGTRLETAIRAHLPSSLQHSDYTSASIRAFAFLPPALQARCRDERRAYEALWRGIVADLARAGRVAPGLDADALRLMLLGAVNWAGEWYRPGRLPIDALARDFARAVLRPLRLAP